MHLGVIYTEAAEDYIDIEGTRLEISHFRTDLTT